MNAEVTQDSTLTEDRWRTIHRAATWILLLLMNIALLVTFAVVIHESGEEKILGKWALALGIVLVSSFALLFDARLNRITGKTNGVSRLVSILGLVRLFSIFAIPGCAIPTLVYEASKRAPWTLTPMLFGGFTLIYCLTGSIRTILVEKGIQGLSATVAAAKVGGMVASVIVIFWMLGAYEVWISCGCWENALMKIPASISAFSIGMVLVTGKQFIRLRPWLQVNAIIAILIFALASIMQLLPFPIIPEWLYPSFEIARHLPLLLASLHIMVSLNRQSDAVIAAGSGQTGQNLSDA